MHIVTLDDHDLVREGIKSLLSAHPDIKSVHAAKTETELFAILESEKIDLVLLDIKMPQKNGFEVMYSMKKTYPKLPVLFLSNYPEEDYGYRAIKIGAKGYLNKKNVNDSLMEAVFSIKSGRKYISPALCDYFASSLSTGNKRAHENLSYREFQVFYSMAQGDNARKIAEKHDIQVNSVYAYKNKILKKMKLDITANIEQLIQT